ncbi:tyrosinase family protein [Azospirillum sp. B4]|uniref:tyrosinase family protein n=1 Tax=Azospirillum sp. B4 TaxID=95605 RepID=UPI00034C9EC0|nr:tyrosinase family protein [Azospirillum sp. B4]
MRSTTLSHFSRRTFLATTAAAAGLSALPMAPARAAAKYRRYNVTSAEGRKALASYAKAVEIMLKLPPTDPRNWFRNAFIHMMDCPHGNWWFFVWHRGYLGYFEQTIRALSGDETFAIPYWDWTELPQIPQDMFDGVLDPTHHIYEAYTKNLAVFTAFIQPSLKSYWATLTPAQQTQLNARGYNTFTDMWNDVTAYVPSLKTGVTGNVAFAPTCGARYLSRDNPKLDARTAKAVSAPTVASGLKPTLFYDADIALSFTSSKTPSHNTAPSGTTQFSILEGQPHNLTHNCIGGVGAIDPGPYGNMTNNLSPVDPIFFLHHSNMDRLWDVWTNKQKRLHLPYLPTGEDLATLSKEPFLFYVNADGTYVGPTVAADFFSTDKFDYDYQPGFGDQLDLPAPSPAVAAAPSFKATLKGKIAALTVPLAAVQSHQAAAALPQLALEITLPHPSGGTGGRSFDVLVNAPPGTTEATPDSPYYAGTISFFGSLMPGMKMSHDATFILPLPTTLAALRSPGPKGAALNVQLVAVDGHAEEVPAIKAVAVRTL